MPTLAAPLDLAKLEARNLRAHQLGAAPSSPVTGQLYYNTGDNTLYWYDGTQWVAAKAGAGTPTGPAGGDLSGTYPNPQIAAGVIVDADVAAANKDGAVGTPSLRTLGSGAQQAMPGNRTRDQIPVAADENMSGYKIWNLADPTLGADAATKQYVDNVAQGLDAKASVKAASTGNLTLSGTQTVDGIALVVNDRVLVKDQTNPAQNGIYLVQSGAWFRDADMDNWAEVPGAFTWVERGTVNADTGWVCTADQGGTLGTTNITWTQFTGAAQLTAGAGLTKTGNTLDVGQGTGIVVAADSIGIDTATVPRYFSSATHGAGTSLSIPQSTHGCRASRGLIVMTVVEATGAEVLADVTVAANGDVTIAFGASQAANSIRTTIIG